MALAMAIYPEHVEAIEDAIARAFESMVNLTDTPIRGSASSPITAEYAGRSLMQGFHTWSIYLNGNWIGDHYADTLPSDAEIGARVPYLRNTTLCHGHPTPLGDGGNAW